MKTNILEKLSNPIKLLGAFALIALICASAPTTGDYAKMITQTRVNNPAQESLQTVNMILCILANTNYSHFIGAGDTLAEVDQNLCQTNGNPGQQSDGSNSSGTPDFLNIIFNAPTVAAGAPQTAKIWITGNVGGGNDDMQMAIDATLSVSQTPTATNPYGLFEFNFTGYPVISGQKGSTIIMQGYVKSTLNASNQQQLEFFESQAGGGGQQKAEQGNQGNQVNQVILVGNGTTTGFGKISMPKMMMDGPNAALQTLAVAYSEKRFLQETTFSGSADQTCYNRESPTNVVYQYGVYDSNGNALVVPASGYPVMYNGQHGYLSYYGLGLPGRSSPTDGDSIQYFASNNFSTPLAGHVIVKNGKLNALNIKQFPLEQLSGMQINVPSANNMPGSEANSNDIITWNSTTQTFSKVGTQTCGRSDGCKTTTLAEPVPYGQSDFIKVVHVSGGKMEPNSPMVGTVGFWLNGLGGGGNTELKLFSNCTFAGPSEPGQMPTFSCSTYNAPTNATQLSIWQSSLVAPSPESTTAVTYYCINQCPYLSNGMWFFGNPTFDSSGGSNGSGGYNNFITYSFNPSTYILTGTSGSANGQTLAVDSSSFGNLMTGPLLTLAQYNTLTDNGTNVPNMSMLFDGTITSYVNWQSGSDSFNKYIGITDESGNPLLLSAPLQLSYSDPVSSGNIFLQYGGIGNLQGIPGSCVDADGNPVSQDQCGQAGNSWLPAYTLPNGAELTDTSSNNTYWVKQLFAAQIMKTASDCSSLEADLLAASQLTLPTLAGFTPVSNGTMPTITKVSVINGVAQ